MSVPLTATEYGAGKPVAILHGLSGAGRNWAGAARRLADRHRVIVFDLRNHGASGWADTMTYTEMADDVQAAMAARGHRRYAIIGHSMGGKVAMVAALRDGGAVERLVVVDVAPVGYAVPYRAYAQAMRRLDLSAITRRAEADAALADVVADPAERGFLLQSLVFETGRAARWQLNLAVLDAEMPTIAGFPALPPEAKYGGPALFIAGGKSRYLLPQHEAVIRSRFVDAKIVRIEDAGHLPHVERADAFLSLTQEFLGC